MLVVHCSGKRQVWSEELILTLQGIITHKDLPLVYNSQSICEGDTRCSCILSVDNKKKPYLCQSMQITGLNTKTFKTGINNLHMLHIMAHQIPKGLMDQYNPSSYLEYSSIDLRTCYLTACQDNPLRTAMIFHPNTAVINHNGHTVHGEDNQVL